MIGDERLRRVARLASVGLVLVLTLPPQAGGTAADFSPLCVVCGATGVADALLNVVLFIPLGAAVARPGGGLRGVAKALAMAALLSAAVEGLQVAMPGRHPGLGDLLANSAGGGLGGLLSVTAWTWLRPDPALAGRLAAGWGAVVAGLLLATALFLVPSLPASVYSVQWVPDLGQFERFEGNVLEARAGSLPLTPLRMTPGARDSLVGLLGPNLDLVVRARFGPPTSDLAPVVSVFDGRQREIFVLGQDGSDLVFRLRRRADDARLRRPEHRAPGLLAGVAPGETRTLRVVRPGGRDREGFGRSGRICLGVDGTRRCRAGFPVGRGWSLMLPSEAVGAAARWVDAAWVTLVFLPLGFWIRRRLEGLIGAALAGGALLATPALGPVGLAGTAEVAGLVVGLGAGLAAARAARSSYIGAGVGRA